MSPCRPDLTGSETVPRKHLPRKFAGEIGQPRKRQRARLNHPVRKRRRSHNSLCNLQKHRSPRVRTSPTPEP